jgi:hypothetical protein
MLLSAEEKGRHMRAKTVAVVRRAIRIAGKMLDVRLPMEVLLVSSAVNRRPW